jgi:tRNA G18 (ribose-2'-O)-methylase SpoU
VVVVLDDVRSRHNVGSFFRTADAFGVERLVLCGFTPLPPHREIEKTALGATLSVPWSHAPSVTDAITTLKAEGYRVLAVEQTLHAQEITDLSFDADTRLALVLGNELEGVSDAAVAAADACIVVPQHGSKHSLNVSVCAGVVLWWLAGRHPGPR